ncbi:MAG: hypothetical protein OEZ22_07535 [Spirochaetia bacterium]|nr:hypothetical protein [Spirochaetia bacterium]
MNYHLSLSFLFFIIFSFSYSLFSQEETLQNYNSKLNTNLENNIERYKKYSISDIKKSTKNSNVDEVISSLNNILNEFYKSDPSKRKIRRDLDIETEREFDYPVSKEWNKNTQRLFINEFLSTPAKRKFIKEAPNIFLAHYYLAKAYQQKGEINLAARHFLSALQYRTLKFSTEVFLNKDRLALIESEKNEKNTAEDYQKRKENLIKMNKEERELKENNIILEDKMLRQSASDIRESLNQIENNKKALTDIKTKKNEILLKIEDLDKTYKNFEKAWNIESAEFLYEVAHLTREIETTLKEKHRSLDERIIYKTNFNSGFVQDFSPNRNFTAYAEILSLAAKLNPENPRYFYILGNEYKTSEKNHKAIYSFENALKTNETTENSLKLTDTEVSKIMNTLGSLYYRLNKYVESAYYYEKALEKSSENQKENLIFLTAEIHTEKTGNFERAEFLLLEYQNILNNKNEDFVLNSVNLLKTKIITSSLLSQVYFKTRQYTKMLEALKNSQSFHEQIENIIIKEREKQNFLFELAMQAKIPVLEEDIEQEVLERYYKAKEEYEDQKHLIAGIESIRNSLTLKKIYFTLAEHQEKSHDIKGAIESYKKAELMGILPDEARRHIVRLRNKYNLK